MKNFKYILFFCIFTIFVSSAAFAEEYVNTTATKHPDYACMYLGEDKCENFNRKMFKFNTTLNKVLIKPVDII